VQWTKVLNIVRAIAQEISPHLRGICKLAMPKLGYAYAYPTILL